MFPLKRFFPVFLFLIFGSSLAHAQAVRVWVSGVGDDLNPCSRALPCKTFASALSRVADGGEIDALDAGGYGPVTINKSVTVDGGGALAAITNPGQVAGVTINAPSTATVTLRNLSINGNGTGMFGVWVQAAGAVLLENLQISDELGSSGSGISITVSAPTRVAVRNCAVSNSTSAGITADGGGSNVRLTVEQSRMSRNGYAGISAAYTTLTLRGCTLSHNSTGLALAWDSSAHVYGSSISQNRFGILVGAPVALYGSQITGNEVAFVRGAGGVDVSSHGNNAIIGNGDIGLTPVAVGLQ